MFVNYFDYCIRHGLLTVSVAFKVKCQLVSENVKQAVRDVESNQTEKKSSLAFGAMR